jgi:hypothetical protein
MPSCSGSEWTDVDCSSRASCRQPESTSLSGGDFATRHALRLDEEAHQRVAVAGPKPRERLSTSPVAQTVDGHVLPFYDLLQNANLQHLGFNGEAKTFPPAISS